MLNIAYALCILARLLFVRQSDQISPKRRRCFSVTAAHSRESNPHSRPINICLGSAQTIAQPDFVTYRIMPGTLECKPDQDTHRLLARRAKLGEPARRLPDASARSTN